MEQNLLDIKFMKAALKQAELAFALDEVPVGAVLVIDGKIITRSHNKKETKNDPTSHAEIEVIRKACKKINNSRLVDATLYVTIEPCSMCAGALMWTQVKRIVYGAKEPKGGALGSSFNLFEQKNINHKPEVTSGVLEDQCSKIMIEFFKSKRK